MNLVISENELKGGGREMLPANLYYARMGLRVVILFNRCPPLGEEGRRFQEAGVVSDNGPANWDITCLKLSNG